MKRKNLLMAACCAWGVAVGAHGATHKVHFDTLAQGQLPTNFTSQSVDMVQLAYTDTIGNVCNPTQTGVAIINTQSFGSCPLPSPPNQLTARSVIIDFDMPDFVTQLGGPVKKVVFKYAQLVGNVQIVFNSQCFTRASFTALPNGNYGGVKYSATPCRVRLRKQPNDITQFSVGGALLAIDDVRASD